MAETYFPFDAGAGATVLETEWSDMSRFWHPTGVLGGELNELAVSANGSGMTVSVATGRAWIEGFYYENGAVLALTVPAANATNPRIDRVVARLDRTANTIHAQLVAGTPAGSPVAPALVQTSTQWDIPLATVRVDAAVVVIASNKVTDGRNLQSDAWRDATAVLGDAGSMALSFASDARNYYRFRVLGKTCWVQYNQITIVGGTRQNSYSVLLPVPAAHAHNAFSGAIENGPAYVGSDDALDRLYMRRSDLATLAVSVSGTHHTFSGSYEVA